MLHHTQIYHMTTHGTNIPNSKAKCVNTMSCKSQQIKIKMTEEHHPSLGWKTRPWNSSRITFVAWSKPFRAP
jgi:hypothetical protein